MTENFVWGYLPVECRAVLHSENIQFSYHDGQLPSDCAEIKTFDGLCYVSGFNGLRLPKDMTKTVPEGRRLRASAGHFMIGENQGKVRDWARSFCGRRRRRR